MAKMYKDPRTGVWCARNDQYVENPEHLPGATMIPSHREGNEAGRSLGYDPNAPKSIVIDPDMPDGGQVVDMSKVTPDSLKAAAMRGGTPGEILKRAAGEPAVTPPARSNTPGYVVPQSMPGGGQTGVDPNAQVQIQPDQQEEVNLLVNVAAEKAAGPQSGPLSAKPQELIRSGTPDSHQAPVQQSPTQPETVVPPPPPPEVSLNPPGLSVVFELGIAGSIAASFHAVIESEHCIALIYDTKFQGGFIYNPGIMEKPIYLVLSNGKRLPVMSMGLSFRTAEGALVTVLPVLNEESAGFESMIGEEE